MLPGKNITPQEILKIARRRVALLVIPPLVTTFAALVYSSTLPNLYQSDMLIAVDPQRVPDSFVQSSVTLQTYQRLDAITVQVMSRTNLERVILENDLYPEFRRQVAIDDVVAEMRNNVRVELERGRPGPRGEEAPNAFHVRFTYPDPHIATRVTQQLGLLFVNQNQSDRRSQATATNSFLETQLAEARTRLEEQEGKLEGFRQRHGKELPTQMQSNMQAIASMQMQVQSIVESIARDRDRRQMLERLYQEGVNEPPPAVAVAQPPGAQAAPEASSFRQQLANARASLAGLERRYTPDHPDVIRARRLVAELEPRAAAETAATREASTGDTATPAAVGDPQRRESLRQMRAEIESLDRQATFKEAEERRMRGEIAEYQRRIEAVPGLESEWVKLTRDYDTQQTAYKSLLAKSEAAKVASDLEQENIGERFRIVDEARVPVRPVDMKRLRYNGLGLGIGLVLGVAIAALLELRDTSFRSDADVLEVLRLPVLANVPQVLTEAEIVRDRRKLVLLAVAGACCVVGAGYTTWILQLWKSVM
jgi:succinoglycan biosynthesis transport protein ExoP